MCPHTTTCVRIPLCVSAYHYVCPHTTMCVRILLYVSPHTTIYVSSRSAYHYICVRIPLYMSSYLYIYILQERHIKGARQFCVRIPLYADICVCAYHYMRVLIPLYTCPHTTTYVSSYHYLSVLIPLSKCPHTTIYMSCRSGIAQALISTPASTTEHIPSVVNIVQPAGGAEDASRESGNAAGGGHAVGEGGGGDSLSQDDALGSLFAIHAAGFGDQRPDILHNKDVSQMSTLAGMRTCVLGYADTYITACGHLCSGMRTLM
jgi:hypothetical protein